MWDLWDNDKLQKDTNWNNNFLIKLYILKFNSNAAIWDNSQAPIKLKCKKQSPDNKKSNWERRSKQEASWWKAMKSLASLLQGEDREGENRNQSYRLLLLSEGNRMRRTREMEVWWSWGWEKGSESLWFLKELVPQHHLVCLCPPSTNPCFLF